MSEPADLRIVGRRIYTAEGFRPLAIAVRDGRIVSLSDPASAPPAKETYDAGDLPVLPGIIDPHTHMRDPGYTEREDWANGTRAAALGGVTCVLEHPNSVPPVHSAANLEAKREIAQAKAVVDFGLFGGVGDGTVERIPEMASAGAVAFKTFLWPYPDRADEFEGIYTVDDAVLFRIFEGVAEAGRPSCVHAESYPLVSLFSERMRRQGRVAPVDHEAGRPVIGELEAVWRTMLMAQAAGARLNLLHISSGTAATAVKRFREGGGTGVTVETCPPYLSLTRERLSEVGPYAKINPPLRSPEERELLWERVRDGTVDTLGSDHGPHEFAAKERGWQDIYQAPAGAPGISTSLPVMLTHVSAGRLSLRRLVELMSVNVARLYGLYPRKGAIAVGSDADLVVIDPQHAHTLDPARLGAKDPRVARMFEGFQAVGRPVLTVVRGRMVMRDGELVGEPGWGRFVPPE